MNIENLSTLKIHKLTQEQYDRALAEDNIDPNAIYLTPESSVKGVSPHIGDNGNWWIGDEDTGVAATAGAEAAEAAAERAESQALLASNSANDAASSASEASGYATSASRASSNANTAMTNAETAATNAANSASSASSSASTATTQANNAKNSASAAATSASQASTSATQAGTSASEAGTAANTAKGYRDEVKNMLDNAVIDPSEAVLVTSQNLTNTQKVTARENIGAASQADFEALNNEKVALAERVDAVEDDVANLQNYTLTDADKVEIAEMVEGATVVQAPTFVDSVDEMTDTSKVYILKSTGTIWAYTSGGGTTIETVTEQIVGTTDNPWGAGRLSSGNPNGLSGYVTTPYIDFTKYSVPFELHLEGIQFLHNNDGNIRYSVYNTSKAHKITQNTNRSAFRTDVPSAEWTENTADLSVVIGFTPPVAYKDGTTLGYARFSGNGTEANANVYITYEGEVAGGSAWVDTGVVYGSGETILNIDAFTLTNPSVKSFMGSTDYNSGDYSYTQVTDYISADYYRKDLPFPVILGWNKHEKAVQYTVSLNGQMYYTTDNVLSAWNLIPNTTYPYKVYALCADGTTKLVKSDSFTTADTITRMLNIEGIQNVRDIGGYTGLNSNKVRYGLIYRGSAMDETLTNTLCITDNGRLEFIKNVGIRTDLDLRYGHTESALGEGIDFIKTSSGYENYANAITNATQRNNFKTLLESIVTQLSANKPIYIHCSGGCDRTGTFVFLLLGLLGVGESDLAKEWELSSFSNIGKGRLRDSTTYKYADMVTAIKAYSGTTITDKFVAFATECGVSADTIASFRGLMLISATAPTE